MKAINIAKLKTDQDGAIFGGYLFNFSTKGAASVYKMSDVLNNNGQDIPYSSFILDKSELICPHSNSVSFGVEYYEEGDEFPLLYSTVYNTYKNFPDRHEGECCVYRIWRDGESFKSKLVQLIKISFVDDINEWKSLSENRDVRPYGNFTVDRENRKLYAFVMRDAPNKTRLFEFNLPDFNEGIFDERLGCFYKALEKSDILSSFDFEYTRYMQGSCCCDGKIYSVEGFSASEENPPAIRIIDTQNKKQIFYKQFKELGLEIEPEFIEFYDGKFYYIDGHGNLFNITF